MTDVQDGALKSHFYSKRTCKQPVTLYQKLYAVGLLTADEETQDKKDMYLNMDFCELPSYFARLWVWHDMMVIAPTKGLSARFQRGVGDKVSGKVP